MQQGWFWISLYLDNPGCLPATRVIDVSQLAFDEFTRDLEMEFGYDARQDQIQWTDPTEADESSGTISLPINTVLSQHG